MAHFYPIFLNLEGKNCLIIGGGKVAERKAAALLGYGANIKIVSPVIEKTLKLWHDDGRISWLDRKFRRTDIEGIFIVFVATNDKNVTDYVVELCRRDGIMVNAVDDPLNCDFFVPSVLRRGSLAIAISTEGKSPTFARKLRHELEDLVTPEYGELVEILGEHRDYIKSAVDDIHDRGKIFEEMVYSDALDLLKAGEKDRARERIKNVYSLGGAES